MNINKFKEGDIITRVAPCIYNTQKEIVDGSYIGDRLTLLGHDEKSKIIFYENSSPIFAGDTYTLSYGRDGWDEGWDYYPKELEKRIKDKIKKDKSKWRKIKNFFNQLKK